MKKELQAVRKQQPHVDVNGLNDLQRQRVKRLRIKYNNQNQVPKTPVQLGEGMALLGGII